MEEAKIPKNRLVYAYYVCTITSLCMFMYGYDASTFNTVNAYDSWNAYYGDTKSGNKTIVSAAAIGNVNTGYTVGAIFTGFFISSIISDKFGRKLPMVIGSVLVIGFSFMQAFAPSFLIHVLGRGGIGLGQGLMLPAGPVYIGELAPKKIRGTMMSFWQLFYSVGAFFAYLVGLITINLANIGDWQWRWVIFLQIVAPTLFIILLAFCPESPRWLINKGRIEDARKVLSKIRADEQIESEIQELSEIFLLEREQNPGEWAVYKTLFTRRKMVKRLLMAMFINFGQQCSGQNSLNNYSSKIYKAIFPSNIVAIINVCNSIAGILFTLNSTFFVDRIGRIKIFIIGAIGMGLCSALCAIVYDVAPVKDYTLGIGLVIILFTFAFFYKPTWGATTWIYTAEIFPITVRAQAVGIASQTQNIASLILGQVFPLMYNAWSFNVFFFFLGCNTIMAIVISFYPETRGVALEDMDELFDGPAKQSPVQVEKVIKQ